MELSALFSQSFLSISSPLLKSSFFLSIVPNHECSTVKFNGRVLMSVHLDELITHMMLISLVNLLRLVGHSSLMCGILLICELFLSGRMLCCGKISDFSHDFVCCFLSSTQSQPIWTYTLRYNLPYFYGNFPILY